MQCSECATDLDDALILVCDHNLCLFCAAKKSAGTGSIRCRICSSTTTLEPSSAQQLKEIYPQFSAVAPQIPSPSMRPIPLHSRPPLSHIPLNIPSPSLSARSAPIRLPSPGIANYSAHQSGHLDSCGQCERTRADLRCLQCEEVLCFDCSESLHRKGKMASHQIVPFNSGAGHSTPMSSANSPMSRSSFADRSVITMRSVSCGAHPDEVVQYFCLKCESKPMCSECVFRSGEHTNHLQEVVLIKKAFPKVKNRINDLVVEFEKSVKEIKINEINLSENKKTMENINHNCKSQLGRLFNELREVIRVKELELTSKIEQVVDQEIKTVEKESVKNAEKRSRIESVSRLLGSVSDVQGTSALEKEIELLDSFAEMKSIIAESKSELLKNDISLVQLFIPSDQVSVMTKQIEFIKEAISDMRGIIPNRNAPSTTVSTSYTTPEITPALLEGLSTGASSGRKRRSKKGSSGTSTPSDQFLMNVIDEAMRAS